MRRTKQSQGKWRDRWCRDHMTSSKGQKCQLQHRNLRERQLNRWRTWMRRRDEPGRWSGYVGYFVCKPAEDMVEDAKFGRVTDGFVFLDETHSNLLYGIA